MNDYSIDLETLGNRFNAAILSIGAVQFDRYTGNIGKTFYREVNIDSALRFGEVTGSTLQWWMGQGDNAKRIFSDQNKATLAQALMDLGKFLPTTGMVWGNGATFDITILEHAAFKQGLTLPWQFWNIRDMRTAVDMVGYRKGDLPFEGVAHNALDDAKHQAKVIAHCFGKVTGKSQAKATRKPAAPADDEDLL